MKLLGAAWWDGKNMFGINAKNMKKKFEVTFRFPLPVTSEPRLALLAGKI